MDKKLEIVKEIVALSVDITDRNIAKASLRFFPSSENIEVTIEYGKNHICGMTEYSKSFKTLSSSEEGLNIILKELRDLSSNNKNDDSLDDFLG